MRKVNVSSGGKYKYLAVLGILLVIVGILSSYYIESKNKNVVRVAVIGDTLNGEPFLMQACEEMERLSKVYNFQWEYFPCERDKDKNLEHWDFQTREAAKSNYNVIIGLGQKSSDIFAKASVENINSSYVTIDSLTGNNIYTSYAFNETESAYILGAMVGKAFSEDTIFGYVSSFRNQSSYRYRYGFEQGLLSEIPNAEVIYEFTQSNVDADASYKATKNLIDSGANFIAGGVSYVANNGVFNAVLENSTDDRMIYTSGIGGDQTTADNRHILGGTFKDTSKSIAIILNEYFNLGGISDGVKILGMEDDSVGVIHINQEGNYLNSDIFTPEIIDFAIDLQEKFIKGEISLVAPEENV